MAISKEPLLDERTDDSILSLLKTICLFISEVAAY
jgi:hypothetical protein